MVVVGGGQLVFQALGHIGAVSLPHQTLRRQVGADELAPAHLDAAGHVDGAAAGGQLDGLAHAEMEVGAPCHQRANHRKLAGLHVHRGDVVFRKAALDVVVLGNDDVLAAANGHDGAAGVHDGSAEGDVGALLLQQLPGVGGGVVAEQALLGHAVVHAAGKHQDLALPQRQAHRAVAIAAVRIVKHGQLAHVLPGTSLGVIAPEGAEGQVGTHVVIEQLALGEGIDVAIQADELGGVGGVGKVCALERDVFLVEGNVAVRHVGDEADDHGLAAGAGLARGERDLALAGGEPLGRLHPYGVGAPAHDLGVVAADSHVASLLAEVAPRDGYVVLRGGLLEVEVADDRLGRATLLELGEVEHAVGGALALKGLALGGTALEQGDELQGTLTRGQALVDLGRADGCGAGGQGRSHGGAAHEGVGDGGAAQADAVDVDLLVVGGLPALVLEHERDHDVAAVGVGRTVLVPEQLHAARAGLREVDGAARPADAAGRADGLVAAGHEDVAFLVHGLERGGDQGVPEVFRDDGIAEEGDLGKFALLDGDLERHGVAVHGVALGALVGALELRPGDGERASLVKVVAARGVGAVDLVRLGHGFGAKARIGLDAVGGVAAVKAVVGGVGAQGVDDRRHVARALLGDGAHDHGARGEQVGLLGTVVAE